MSKIFNHWDTLIRLVNSTEKAVKAGKLTAEGLDKAIQEIYTPVSIYNIIAAAFRKPIPEAQILELLPKLYALMKIEYPNAASRNVKLSYLRNALKAHQTPKVFELSKHREYFNISKTEKDKIRSNYEADVIKRNKNPIEINADRIKHMMGIMSKSDNVYDKAVFVLMATGIRPIEVFIATFKRTTKKGFGKNYLNIGNLAKRRDDKIQVLRPVIFATPNEIIAAVKKIREEIPPAEAVRTTYDDSPRLLQSAARQGITKASEYNFEIKPHMARKYYVALAYDIYGEKTNFNVFIREVLGHQSLGTSFSYSIVRPTSDAGQKVPKKVPKKKKVCTKSADFCLDN